MNPNLPTPSPTLAGFAAWLSASADSLMEAAAKAENAGDPARGRQIYILAQFLRPIGRACDAFASGQEPELVLAGEAAALPANPAPAAAVPVAQTAREKAVDSLARFQRELGELNAEDAALQADLEAMRARVIAHGEAKRAVIERLTAEIKALRANLPG